MFKTKVIRERLIEKSELNIQQYITNKKFEESEENSFAIRLQQSYI